MSCFDDLAVGGNTRTRTNEHDITPRQIGNGNFLDVAIVGDTLRSVRHELCELVKRPEACRTERISM